MRDNDTVKRCARCGESKPLSEFYLNSKADPRPKSYCKVCHKATIPPQQAWSTTPTTDRVPVTCLHCGRQGFIFPSRSSKRKFCSQECRSAYARTDQQIRSRFLQYVDINQDKTLCWEWQGGLNDSGYGKFRASPEVNYVTTHRFAFEMFVRPLKPGELVLHRCDNPPCVNPNHLFTGTHQDNVDDRERKGRGARVVGSQHHAAVFTEDQVILIRELYAKGGVSQSELAKQFGVSTSAISNVVYRTRWKHV